MEVNMTDLRTELERVLLAVEALPDFNITMTGKHAPRAATVYEQMHNLLRTHGRALAGALVDSERLDYIELTFSGMTNRERYLPVTMIWGKGCNGRTLREACDKYMKAQHTARDGGGEG